MSDSTFRIQDGANKFYWGSEYKRFQSMWIKGDLENLLFMEGRVKMDMYYESRPVFTDSELLKLQKFASDFNMKQPLEKVAEDIKTLMDFSDEIYNLGRCNWCFYDRPTFYGEGGKIPDGRVTCPKCGRCTAYHKHTSKQFDFRFNKYRDMRAAREDWKNNKVMELGEPDLRWK